MCQEKSFRDAPRALLLAKSAVDEAPERGDAWLTLALAHYRNGNLQAADDAVQHSIKRSRGDVAGTYNELLLAMIRRQQAREEEARQLHEKARAWIVQTDTHDEDLTALAAEAMELIR
jgi:hypothetical protein